MQFSSRYNLLFFWKMFRRNRGNFPAKVSNYIYIFICPLGGPIVKNGD